ncbi:amino acid ABC transporter permease [Frigoribacterium sp. CG_9.8]|uniref:amino acid ABC transporter permease n=1 Tax=Frigoribacterium sp. CG_9.8 TaxID=2787733 RepID=UPI00351C9E45
MVQHRSRCGDAARRFPRPPPCGSDRHPTCTRRNGLRPGARVARGPSQNFEFQDPTRDRRLFCRDHSWNSLLVQLVYIFFVLPSVGINIDPVPAGILGLGLNYAAYLSEVFRSAILSVEHGQTEAALSLGYTPTKTLWKIVIPQSFVVSLEPIGNYFIAMVKVTALTSVIAVTEILKTANILNSQTFQTTAIYTAAAIPYLIISLPLSRIVVLLERKARSLS